MNPIIMFVTKIISQSQAPCSESVSTRLARRPSSFFATPLRLFLGALLFAAVGLVLLPAQQASSKSSVTDLGAYNNVTAITMQPDGKIVVGGRFTQLGGQSRQYIGRLNANGSVDTDFNPGDEYWIDALTVQPDGKILVGEVLSDTLPPRDHIKRLNADGNLDSSFVLPSGVFNDSVNNLVIQSDGKIVVGGLFAGTRNRLARLNQDGSLDTSFNPNANDKIRTIALQTDGKILVGGDFTTLGVQPHNRIGRLNPDGSPDTSFTPPSVDGTSPNIQSIAVQTDGKILVGGKFPTLDGQPHTNIGRLNPDGTLDATFTITATDTIYSMAVQTDGKILVGGYFQWLGTQARRYFGRLNPDGIVDSSFIFNVSGNTDPDVGPVVLGIGVQTDGQIIVGGNFTQLGGQSATCLGRLSNDAAMQSLSVNNNHTVVTWTRSGAGPEVWRVTFELSTDGMNYTPLGDGVRISGGWQLGGLSLPFNQNLYLRARGYYGTGYHNGSGSITQATSAVYGIQLYLPLINRNQ